jgi:PAS domain S-box-containing protein
MTAPSSDAAWATPSALLELWRSLAETDRPPAALLDGFSARLAALVGGTVTIDLAADDGTIHRAAAASGPPGGPTEDEGLGAAAEVIRSGVGQLSRAGGAQDVSWITVPLPGPERVLGALTATRRAVTYDEEDFATLQAIATCAGRALASAQSHARLGERLAALGDREAWLRELLDSSPAVIFLKDLEGRYVTVNKRCLKQMGRRLEELVGKTGFDLLPAPLAESFHRVDRQVIESGDIVETEDKFMMGGEWRVFLAVKFPVRDAGGAIRGTAGMSTEITNRVRAEEALRRGREQLSFITDALPALVAYLDAQQRYHFLNSAHEVWFGVPRSQFSGRTLRDFFDAEAYATMLPYITRTLGGETCAFEATIRRPGAPARHTRITFSPNRNFSGEVEGFVALVTDETEHKQSEGRNRLLADASEVLGASFDHETTLPRVAELVVRGMAGACRIELDGRGGDGTPFAVEVPGGETAPTAGAGDRAPDPLLQFEAPIRILGETVGRIRLRRAPGGQRFEAADFAVGEELARRIALAVQNAHLYGEAQRAIRVRDEFMSIASHELRTPLTALALDVEILRRQLDREGGDPRAIQRVNKVDGHLGRLRQLVGTLLDVSQIEAGRLAIAAEALDLRVAVGEVIDRFTEQAARSKCQLRASLPAGPVEGVWDRSRIDQILTNLVGNAVRYAPGKPIDIELVEAPGSVRLIVRDHGPGIRREDRERIFGRFERAASGQGIGGFGLGLWITRQIVTALGGSIRVESVHDVETSFIIELPRQIDG